MPQSLEDNILGAIRRTQERLSVCALSLALAACAVEPVASTSEPVPASLLLASASSASTGSRTGSADEQSDTEIHSSGELLYQERCATCHDTGRAPPRSRIAANTPTEILDALDTGFMAAIALFLTPEQKTILARHLSDGQDP